MTSVANSFYCRLCGERNKNGIFLYGSEGGDKSLDKLINAYLPVKVCNDNKYPKTICPGCNIQLDGTIEFFKLIIRGQEILRRFLKQEQKKANASDQHAFNNQVTYPLYLGDHPISLSVEGKSTINKKRGRPRKVINDDTETIPKILVGENEESIPGKRKRKPPSRFSEAVQGVELDKALMIEGIIDKEEEIDHDTDVDIKDNRDKEKPVGETRTEIIGRLHKTDGLSDEFVVFTSGKGRGRPKGAKLNFLEKCTQCGREFKSRAKYMSHIAAHEQTKLRKQSEEAKRQAEALNEEIKGEQGEEEIENNERSLDSNEKIIDELPDLSDAIQNTEGFITTDENELLEVRIENNITDVGQSGDSNVKKKYLCNICEKSFNSKQSRWVHVRGVHKGEKPYKCPECEKAFPYKRSLNLHSLIHRRSTRYACDVCGKIFRHQSSVIYHKEACHSSEKYACLRCDKIFKHKQLLIKHQLTHNDERPYVCKDCDMAFKTRSNLFNHQVLHSGIKAYNCPQCPKSFAHKTSFSLHLRWHAGIKPHQCKDCGKSFLQRGNLREHERTHTGEKPFKCKLCNKRFTTSSQLRIHNNTHNKKKTEKPKIVAMTSQTVVKKQTLFRSHRADCAVYNRKTPQKLMQHIAKTYEVPKSKLLKQNIIIEQDEESSNVSLNEIMLNLDLSKLRYDENGELRLDLDSHMLNAAAANYPAPDREHTFSINNAEIELEDMYGRKIELNEMGKSKLRIVNGQLKLQDESEEMQLELANDVFNLNSVEAEEEICGYESQTTNEEGVEEREGEETGDDEQVVYVTYSNNEYTLMPHNDGELIETEDGGYLNLPEMSENDVEDHMDMTRDETNEAAMKTFEMASGDPLQLDPSRNEVIMTEDGVEICNLDEHYFTVG